MQSSYGDSLRTKTLVSIVISLTSFIGDTALFAQCPPSTLQGSFLDKHVADDPSENPTIGMSSTGEIIVAWDGSTDGTEIQAVRYHADGSGTGTGYGTPFPITGTHPYDIHLTDDGERKTDASLAVSADDNVTIAFIGELILGKYNGASCTDSCTQYNCTQCVGYDGPGCDTGGNCWFNVSGALLNSVQFPFTSTPSAATLPVIYGNAHYNLEPSAGIRSGGSSMFAWANTMGCSLDAPFGWFRGPSFSAGASILSCDPCSAPDYCLGWGGDPQPCIAMRSDGYFLVAWADPERPDLASSHFNIYVQAFTATGTSIGNRFWVNNNSSDLYEYDPSSQVSCAVAMDSHDGNGRSNIVVTWTGPYPHDGPFEPASTPNDSSSIPV